MAAVGKVLHCVCYLLFMCCSISLNIIEVKRFSVVGALQLHVDNTYYCDATGALYINFKTQPVLAHALTHTGKRFCLYQTSTVFHFHLH